MTTSADRFTKMTVVATFFVILLFPVVQMVTGLFHIPVLDENRTRERAPTSTDLLKPVVFFSRSQKWFEDHYGFRDLLIRLKTQIDYSVFGVSDRVYIGVDGWLYYRNVIDNQKPAEEAMADAQLDAVVKKFSALGTELAARNIKMIVITNQLKDKFYPEYLPYMVRGNREHQRFDDFRAKMRLASGATYMDTTEVLTTLKTSRQIFHKTDFHWNDPAAAEVARLLVDKIAAFDGRKVPAWRYPLKIEVRKLSGDQALFLPLFSPPAEDALFVDQRSRTMPSKEQQNAAPFESIFSTPAKQNDLLPTTVLYGDSFSDGMLRAGLSDHFGALYRARRGEVKLSDVLEKMPADTKYFVFQFIEVWLPGYVNGPL